MYVSEKKDTGSVTWPSKNEYWICYLTQKRCRSPKKDIDQPKKKKKRITACVTWPKKAVGQPKKEYRILLLDLPKNECLICYLTQNKEYRVIS